MKDRTLRIFATFLYSSVYKKSNRWFVRIYIIEELNQIKKERNQKAARREKWANRNRLTKRYPINSEIYNLLIKECDGPNYTATRTQIAICLLTVTGIRISELLTLKVSQLETLLTEGWISIDFKFRIKDK